MSNYYDGTYLTSREWSDLGGEAGAMLNEQRKQTSLMKQKLELLERKTFEATQEKREVARWRPMSELDEGGAIWLAVKCKYSGKIDADIAFVDNCGVSWDQKGEWPVADDHEILAWQPINKPEFNVDTDLSSL